jgi:hypothetical protein
LGSWSAVKTALTAAGETFTVGSRVIGSNGRQYKLTGASGANDPTTDAANWTVESADVYANARHIGMATMTNVAIPAGIGLFNPVNYGAYTEVSDIYGDFDAPNGTVQIADWCDEITMTASVLLHITNDQDCNPTAYLAIDGDHTDAWAVGNTGPLIQSGVNGLSVTGTYISLNMTLHIPSKQELWGTLLKGISIRMALGGASCTAVLDKVNITFAMVRFGDNYD